MSDTSITVDVTISGLRGNELHRETHRLEVEPESPLVSIVDMVMTELDEMRVQKIKVIYS